MATIIKLPDNLLDRLARLEADRGDWRVSFRAACAQLNRIADDMTTNRREGDEPEPLSDEDAALAARLRLIC